MKINDLVKVLSGGCDILESSAKAAGGKIETYVADRFVKGAYVTREEFDALKETVERLRKELSLKKTDSNG